MDEKEKLAQVESTGSSERFERIKDSAAKILDNLAALLKVKSLLTVSRNDCCIRSPFAPRNH